MKYDFIVVGNGLSGSYFCDLASNYASVLLIEKSDIERKFPNENLFEKHSYYYSDSENPFPLDNKQIFPQDHLQMRYSGKNSEGTIESKEFGESLGSFCDINQFIKFMNKRAEKKGASLHFNTEIKKIAINNDSVEIISKDDEKFKGDVIVIATGSGDSSKIDKNNPNTESSGLHEGCNKFSGNCFTCN